MNIHILAGGPPSLVPDFVNNKRDIIWAGVDRGAYELIRYGIQPSYAFGDFDSISERERETLGTDNNVYVFPQAKDKTDLELAVDWAVSKQPESIVVFGATGGRLDHELANIQLLKKGVDAGVDIEIVDRQNSLTAKARGRYTLEADGDFPYVSFLPLGDGVTGLTLEGFKYPLNDLDVQMSDTLTVSNEFIAESGTFSFSKGIVIVIRSRD